MRSNHDEIDAAMFHGYDVKPNFYDATWGHIVFHENEHWMAIHYRDLIEFLSYQGKVEEALKITYTYIVLKYCGQEYLKPLNI